MQGSTLLGHKESPKPKDKATGPVISDDPDRRAAEWVLSTGGRVQMREVSQTKISDWISVADKLPSGRFNVQVIDLFNPSDAGRGLVTDEGLEQLRGLTEINDLQLTECRRVLDRSLKLVGTFKTLQRLSLAKTDVTDAGMNDLRGLAELTYLSVAGSHVTGRGLEPLRDLRKMREFDFGECDGSEAVVDIAKSSWPELQALTLPGTVLTEAGVTGLASLPTISALDLTLINVTDDQLRRVAPLLKLPRLRLMSYQVSDTGLEHLRTLTNLKLLHLNNTKVTAAGVAKLQQALPNCKIEWDGAKSVTGGVPAFSDDPDRRAAEWVLSVGGKVTVREVSQTKISGLITVADKLPSGRFKVQMIDLSGLRQLVTDEGLENLRGLMEITKIGLEHSNVADRSLKLIGTFKTLKSLHLAYTSATDAGLADLRELTELENLSLASKGVTGRGLEPLRNLRKLHELGVPTIDAPEAVVDIAKDSWPELQHLSLPGTVLTDAGVTGLASLPTLSRLDLRLSGATDDQLRRLALLQKLPRLSLAGSPLVSDAGLEHLRTLTNLTYLDVRNTKVTAAGVAKLQQALPNCKIEWDSAKAVTGGVPVTGPVASGTPFVTIRSGAAAARHATLEEALAASQPQDVIEVHGNGPFPIGGPKTVTFKQKEFTLKAGSGFRPLFVSAPSAADNTSSPLFQFNTGTARFEDIDFVSAGPGLFFFNGVRDVAFLRCRCVSTSRNPGGLIFFRCEIELRLSLNDCVLASPKDEGALLIAGVPARIEMTNTLLFGHAHPLKLGASGNNLQMNRCTIVGIATSWSVNSNDLGPRGRGVAELSRCLVLGPAIFFGAPLRLPEDIRWQGKENVYGVSSSGQSGVLLPGYIELPFDEWVKSPAKPETGSKLVPTKAKRLDEFLDPDPAVMFRKLKTYLAELRALHPDVGADPAVADGGAISGATPIDLLARVDLGRDTIDKPWPLKDGSLITGGGKFKLFTPQPMPDEYDVELEIERLGEGGTGCVFGFLMQGRQATVMMDSYPAPHLWGIENIDGHMLKESTNPTAKPGSRLPLNQRRTVRIAVRRTGVSVTVNGERVTDWRGRPEQLSTGFWKIEDTKTLFLGAQQHFAFHRITLTPMGAPVAGTAAVGSAPTGSPIRTLNDPAFQQWMKEVAAQPAEEQVKAVAKKLQELNPDFDGKVTHSNKNGEVFELSFSGEHVRDISPVRALARLKGLGSHSPRPGKLADLSPLQGLSLTTFSIENTPLSDLSPLKGMPLTRAYFGATRVADLSPLQGMPLSDLTFFGTLVPDLSAVKDLKLTKINLGGPLVSDLSPLQGMPLTIVVCAGTQVSDLSPLRGMALTSMDCQNTKVTDLTPLKGMPLTNLRCDFVPQRDTEILRSFKTLESIDYKPAAEFWKSVEAGPVKKK